MNYMTVHTAANGQEAQADRTLRETLEQAHTNGKEWLGEPFKLGACRTPGHGAVA